MKKYIAPALQVNETEVCHMLAESLPVVNDQTVDGSNALSKENDTWEIWED